MENTKNEQTSSEQTSSPEPTNTNQSAETDCATHAYFLWLAEGCPEGCDQQHWFAAEEELRQVATVDAGQAS